MAVSPKIIHVGVSEFRVGSGNCLLESLGIGSCLVLIIYDPVKKIGGLSHSLLPESENQKSHPKYVDSAIELMLAKMKLKGANLESLEAKIVGGANMFGQADSSSLDIGSQNIEAVLKKLKEKGIKITSQETGKDLARNVEFNLLTGRLIINAVSR